MASDSPRDLTRMPYKQSTDLAQLEELLADCYLAQVAFSHYGVVDVVPTAVAVHENRLIWHGSTGSRWMRVRASSVPVVVSVFQVDALVVGRSAFENSFWYRSAAIRGTPRLVEGGEKVGALDALTEAVFPGRVREIRGHRERELVATMVLSIPLDDWTLKLSKRWPDDDAGDVASTAWAGALPTTQRYGPALAAPDLRPDIELPASCERLVTGL